LILQRRTDNFVSNQSAPRIDLRWITFMFANIMRVFTVPVACSTNAECYLIRKRQYVKVISSPSMRGSISKENYFPEPRSLHATFWTNWGLLARDFSLSHKPAWTKGNGVQFNVRFVFHFILAHHEITSPLYCSINSSANDCCNLFVLLTEHHAMKAYWGSGSIAPLFLWPRH
jgi:hypothetical protein